MTRKSTLPRTDFVRTGSQIIECVKIAKLLSIKIDKELRWHAQAATAAKKGTDLLLAINRLTRPSFGLPAAQVSRLFVSMVVPKVEYALPVWYTPVSTNIRTGRKTGSVGHTTQLAKVQRLGCKLITGAFRSTATDVLELHAHIPPIQLRLEDTCYWELLCFSSLPQSHPLHGLVKHSSRSQPRCHPSPIHNLFRHFPLDPKKVEEINPVLQHLTWRPEFTTHIAADKATAAQSIRARIDDIQIYSDGSGYEGNIGAATVVLDLPPRPAT